jgi:5-methylthioribose kinase
MPRMADHDFVLTPHNVCAYLVEQGLMEPNDDVSVCALGGGVSNIVLLVEWKGPKGRSWVIKQSLEKLDVEADWRSERARIFREALALQKLRPILGAAALPIVIHTDPDRYLYIMTAAPAGSVAWKDLLLARHADSRVARNAGLLLAKIINASRENPSLAAEFGDRTIFHQLRLDPYYRTTAELHPKLRREFDGLIAKSLEIRTSLVHGDFSPKNMLVRDENIFLIDFEVVHWGDPAFDAAFLINHLLLKAFHEPAFASQFIALADDFWRTLVIALGSNKETEFEAMTVRHLGGLMLARIDGKSPVEYIEDENTKERVRTVATQIMVEKSQTLELAVGIVKEGINS